MPDLEHPLRVLRVHAGLTQAQLAYRVRGGSNFPEKLTEQYIRRAEQGLVGDDTNLAPIVGVLLRVIKERADNEERISPEEAVESVKGLLGAYALRFAAPSLLHCEQNMDGVNLSEQVRRCIKDWYYLKRRACWYVIDQGDYGEFPRHFATIREFRLEVSRRIGEGPTLYSFCRALALHLFVIQRFEKSTKRIDTISEWPKDLRTAMKIMGVDLSQITIGGKGG